MQQMSDLHYFYAKTLRQPEQRKECLEQALAFQEKALDIKESLIGTLHPEVAKSHANLSSIYFDMVQLDRALEFQLKAVAILQKLFPNGHPNLDISKRNLEILIIKMTKDKKKQS